MEGWSRRRLAKEAGVSVTHITKIEAGIIDPRASTLKKIAKAAGIMIVISIE